MRLHLNLHRKPAVLVGLALTVSVVSSGLAMAYKTAPEETPPAHTQSKAEAPVSASPRGAAPTVEMQPLTGGFAGQAQSRSRFVWPAFGPMTSYLGPGHPTGIDIGLSYGEDSLIRAAAAGTVTFSGGESCCNYGLHVEIEHEDGWSTLYAHFSRIGVKEGQHVEQGELLGAGGSTGFAIGKHLHFELIHDEQYVDPLRYLPPEQTQGRPATTFSCPSDSPLVIDPDSRTSVKLTSSALAGYNIRDAVVEPLAPGQGEPAIEALPQGGNELMIDADAAQTPSGKMFQYRLGITVAKDGADESFDCSLSLRTMQSFPTMVRVQPAIPTATPKASTATPALPGKTGLPPTRTYTPVRTAASTPVPTTKAGSAPAPKSPPPPTPRK